MTSRDLRLGRLYKIIESIAPKLPYHSLEHLMDVSGACRRYALMEGLGSDKVYILEAAGALHDIVYVPERKDNEEKSADLAEELLPRLGYSLREIEEISRLILATKWPTNPKDILEKIICDSDLDSLGRDDFFERGELLRQEWNVGKEKWYTQEVDFLSKVRYYTDSAQKLRQPKLEENFERLRELK